jgi:hypothetical protein
MSAIGGTTSNQRVVRVGADDRDRVAVTDANAPSHRSRNYAVFVAAKQEPEQDVTMRVGPLIIGILTIGATIAGAAQAQDATAQEKALEGTYTQKLACKGDGSSADQAKNRVVIGDKQVDSNFGPCTFGDKSWSGKVLKASATCKNKTGTAFDVSLEFTLKDDNTVGFVEESSQYKSTLYRCTDAGAK